MILIGLLIVPEGLDNVVYLFIFIFYYHRWPDLKCQQNDAYVQMYGSKSVIFIISQTAISVICSSQLTIEEPQHDVLFTVFKWGPILLWEQADCWKRHYLFGCVLHSVFVWEESFEKLWICDLMGNRDGVSEFDKFIFVFLYPGFSLIFLIVLIFKVNETL